ncbi:peptidase M14 [Ramlibacter sp. WS9]|nr:peptidase M14 [Ramlibacter sp. WS9]
MPPGTRMQGDIPVGTMSSGANIALPVTLIKGTTPGPCLWINGQVHGAEVNGVVAAVEFGRRIDPESVTGSIIITPTANPLALDNHSKTAPQDLLDLDQNFPGETSGTVTGHLANALFDQVRTMASCLVNLHTMGPIYSSEPYCIYKIWPGGKVTEAQLLRMTSYFWPSMACRRIDVGGTGELPGNVDGALDYQCLARGIPAFMVELGQGSWYTPQNVELAVRGLMSLGRHLGILSGEPVAPAKILRATRRQWIMVRKGGLFLSTCDAKEIVPAGQLIGRVVTLKGEVVEEVRLQVDSFVIGIRRDPVVHTGDRIGLFATEWDSVGFE